MSAGIDYGMGTTNIDLDTGIRYGVIHHAELGQYWYDSSEPDYGPPTCGWCGNPYDADTDLDTQEVFCTTCGKGSSPDDCYPESPIAHTYEGDGYVMQQGGDDHDIFVLKSPYYTLCAFCSPCAPGAGYLLSSRADGIKAYCPGHDWYEDGIAPYPVYRVSDDTLVSPTSIGQWATQDAINSELE